MGVEGGGLEMCEICPRLPEIFSYPHRPSYPHIPPYTPIYPLDIYTSFSPSFTWSRSRRRLPFLLRAEIDLRLTLPSQVPALLASLLRLESATLCP